MNLRDVVEKFNTTPFLFMGSGMTRRYLGLPDWKGLLTHFAEEVREDEFAYSYYENLAKGQACTAGIMPKVAELIQRDYDSKWFRDKSLRHVSEDMFEKIKDGLSPFKAEVACYIESIGRLDERYEKEISLLRNISEKSVAGVITTNYDRFIEETFSGFTNYIGQTQLIFSAIQGIAEIYKIHGSIELPESIVINEADYNAFDQKGAYLAAKLLTIFMEYPIIFMGYSISDTNIQQIIKDIVRCLDDEKLKQLEDRFIFVEYNVDMRSVEVSPYTIMVDNRPLIMRKIQLSDFSPLYHALSNVRSKLPVRVLRKFKEEIYNYTLTSVPTSNLRVASIDDTRVADEELVLSIGKSSDFGLRGLSGISSNEWYRNIVLDDLDFSSDDILKYAFPVQIRQNSSKLPVNKYLDEAQEDYPECREIAQKYDYESIISNSIKNNRKCLNGYTSALQIWNQEKGSLEKATRLISHLTEEQMNVDELEQILLEIFENDVNVLESKGAEKTHIRRLIMIFDFLKWGKK